MGYHVIEVVIEVGQSGVNLFRPQIGMLTKKLFARPAVMIMLAGQVQDFVARCAQAGNSISIDNNVRIRDSNTHAKTPYRGCTCRSASSR